MANREQPATPSNLHGRNTSSVITLADAWCAFPCFLPDPSCPRPTGLRPLYHSQTTHGRWNDSALMLNVSHMFSTTLAKAVVMTPSFSTTRQYPAPDPAYALHHALSAQQAIPQLTRQSRVFLSMLASYSPCKHAIRSAMSLNTPLH